MESFDITGELPIGTTLLEASAGTGKTFTVAALVTRYVAEGHATLDQLLVITFGRAASQELRERVRDQLVLAERALADPAGADRTHPVIDTLLRGDAAELAGRRTRLRDALATFDAATIATTHQFCQIVLRSLGVAGDTDTGATLVDSLDELVVEVVDDVYLRRFGRLATAPPFGRSAALTLARTVVSDAHATLAAVSDVESDGGASVAFAHEVRAEVDRRKRRRGILSYDDLLGRLADALADDDAPARERMRQRWKIVLVDEFQDTDPTQWQVLDRAFSGHATVVLIGDPKQAIYAFRGGDVVTYLGAASGADTQATLDTNRRSDAALVERLQVVLRGAALGDPRIVVREVSASHPGSRLQGGAAAAPFRIRQVRREGLRTVKGNLIQIDAARDHIARDCAGDIARLLTSGATWCDTAVRAEHVAVLVSAWSQAELVQRALSERGVKAVVGGGTSLLTSPAGAQWLALLEALEQPHRSGRVRAAGLTSFVGRTLAELDDGGEVLTDELADRLRGWALLLRGRGVAALFEATEERGLTARVLGETGGERLLTDLRHVAQTLHETAVRDQLGLTGLLDWLRSERESASQERVRRLDSDAAAVQITTLHQSKGLQYPIVYLPFAALRAGRDVTVALYHDDDTRMLDVSGSGPQWHAHAEAHLREDAGEELRDLYVSLTRAQSQVVTWWAPTFNTPGGGLHRLLFGRQPGQAEVPDSQDVRDDDYVARVLGMLAELGGPEPEVSVVPEVRSDVGDRTVGRLTARDFEREVDTEWRRTSYSGLIRVQEQPLGVTSEPEVVPKDDELEPERGRWDPTESEGSGRSETEASLLARGPVISPMADLPSGAAFGSLVHSVLELVDPEAPDLTAELAVRAREQLPWWPVGIGADELAEALLPSLHTPLGALAGGRRLVDIPLRDRLCELDFEFPLNGGDLPARDRRDVRLRDLAPLLTSHLAAGDPLAPYAAQLAGPLGDQPLRGYLSGSIDVVLRLPSDDGHRYVVVDYKTNVLGDPGTPITTAAYGHGDLAVAMRHSHYPLQALLYSVVLHRFLRWRLPSYDPERHLGGVLYLFLRGMCGPDTPVVGGHVAGVFDWSPPPALVTDLSDLLDGGSR